MNRLSYSWFCLQKLFRLWEICDISLQIIVELKSKDEDFIHKGTLVHTIFQVGQLAIKALGKSDKKGSSQQSENYMIARLSSVMEKVMVIIYFYAIPFLEDPTKDVKVQVNFRRELCTEIVRCAIFFLFLV